MRHFHPAALCLAALLAGCDMAPHDVRPAPPVPPQWPQGAAYEPGQAGAPGMRWHDVFGDARLREVIALALANNRDVRASLAAVAEARAQYHVQRSYQLPTIGANAGANITRGIDRPSANALDIDSYDANIGLSSFEIDLFGRLKNQTKQAFEAYLASESGLRAARLTLVAETATAYATLASDRDLLALAQQTKANAERSLELTQSLYASGLASAGDVQSEITLLEQAKSDIANSTTLVAQDRNALDLLVGAPLPDTLLPASLEQLDAAVGNVPAGLSSQVLLQRPDVLEAEHQLRGANAAIGAARAAFFPTITLTSSVGLASTALSQLFTNGALTWNAAPSANMPLFGGTNPGNLRYARAERDYAVATYEKAVQSAFRDVANALARRGTITDQRAAQDRLVAASAKASMLMDAQFRAGSGRLLDALTAQRTLYAAQQTRISTMLTDISNRIALYAALGADPTL